MSRSVKGLLIKDIRLMRAQMRFFLVLILLWGSFMVMKFEATVFIGYVSILCSFFTLSTFSYDEVDNGAAFLFTLPISRKDYIREKYLFGLLMTAVPFLVATIVSWVILTVGGGGQGFLAFVMSTVVVLPLAFLLLALEIPLYIRFGQEKSRMVTLLCVGFMSVAFGALARLNAPAVMESAGSAAWIGAIGTGGIVAVSAAVLAALLVLSYKLSCRFLEKREF